MKNDDKIQKILNDQYNAEIYSAYLYLGMAGYFEEHNFKGFAQWMHVQAKEEMGHAMRIFKYIHDRGWHVNFASISAVNSKGWKSPLDIFEKSFAHEQKITKSIHKIMDAAISMKDYATQSFLQWFIDEQVEEEASVDEIVQKLKIVGKNQASLLMMDAHLGKRAAE